MAADTPQQYDHPEDVEPAPQPDVVFKSPQEILETNDTLTDVLFIPEWGTNVEVRGITKGQQLGIRNSSLVEGEPDLERSQLGLWREGVIRPKFEEHQLPLLFEKNAGVVDRILKRVLELSGMGEETLKEKKQSFR